MAFRSYVMRLQKKFAWWDLAGWYGHQKWYRSLKTLGLILAREGELLPGVVLMRNTILADRKTAAPALVLGSFDFSVAGLEELNAVADRIGDMRGDPDPSVRRAVSDIYEDEDYKLFRRRQLPKCVAAPDHVILFDELMRGDDFIEMNVEGDILPSPFVVLFANRNNPVLTSAVVPRKVAEPVLAFLIAQKLMSSARTSAPAADARETPPPLPRSTTDGL